MCVMRRYSCHRSSEMGPTWQQILLCLCMLPLNMSGMTMHQFIQKVLHHPSTIPRKINSGTGNNREQVLVCIGVCFRTCFCMIFKVTKELILKIWSLNGFYFYNCFDTDWKKNLAGYGYFIFDNLVARREKQMREGRARHRFSVLFQCVPSFFLCTVAHWRTVSIFLPMQ